MPVRSIRLGTATLLLLASLAGAAEVHTDSRVRFQTIEGWGTCVIGWSLDRTPYNDPAWRVAYRDLGCNILRIPIIKEVLVADRQNPDYRVPVALGADLQANVDRMDFDIAPLNVWADIIQWLRAHAFEPDRIKVSGSAWSPPHWMKGPTGVSQSHVIDPAVKKPTPWLYEETHGDSVGGRLRTEDTEILTRYGRYFAAWMKGFEQTYGVPIYVLSLQNESTFENPFDSMTVIVNENHNTDFSQYAMLLESVKDAWAEYGISTKIMGPHMANIGPTPDNPWGLLNQMRMIDGVKAHADSALIDFLDFYNGNYYMGRNEAAVQATAGYYHGKAAVPANWVQWAYAPGVKQDGKGIWYSEAGGDAPDWLNGNNGATPGDGAITVAQKMHNALVCSDAAAYVYWQMSDTNADETVHTLLGKNHIANPHDSRKYCAFKHFSRYIRPGARRIAAVFENGRTSIGGNSEYDTFNGLNVSAYYHGLDSRLTYVLVNMRAAAESITLHLPAGMPVSTLAAYQTSSTEGFVQLADVSVSSSQASLSVPGYSVVTLTGILAPNPASADFDGDGDADQFDFGILQRCLTPDGMPPVDPSWANLDLDGDGDVDGADLGLFLRCTAGPDVPMGANCTAPVTGG